MIDFTINLPFFVMCQIVIWCISMMYAFIIGYIREKHYEAQLVDNRKLLEELKKKLEEQQQ